MQYDDTGGAPSTSLRMPLVLIHGFPLDRTIWAEQTRGLADAARVIAPDLRGCGGSAMPPDATTMDAYADDVRGLLDALNIQRAIIAGVSMGGYIAFAFYRQSAARVRALILVDTRAGADSPEGKQGRDDNAALARAEGTGAIAERMLPKMLTPQTAATRANVAQDLRALMARQPVEGVAAALIAMRDRPDSTPTLAQISVPTLVIHGAEDQLIPVKESELLRDSIRGARLEIIPHAAHLPNYEQPAAFNRVVKEFLKTRVPSAN
ncbi:MAG: alpha/beta fold hydrolase [Chloroflexi bacterium]|nr:alpha/beta fold hydrolase [Chloroflexota bacterium]